MTMDIRDVCREDIKTGDDGVIIYWLAGSGFVFKFASGEIVCVDPYLSDCVERIAGFRRLSLAPLTAAEMCYDLLLLSHDHPDHLDVDSIEQLVAANPKGRVAAGGSCRKTLEQASVAYQPIKAGEKITVGSVEIDVVEADHGELCPEAVGFILKFNGRSIYWAGDTGLNQKMLAEPIAAKPEIVIPCINGAFGNLNEAEAAKLVGLCNGKKAVPAHFWLFAEHGGDPAKFKDQLAKEAPQAELVLLTPGRGVAI